jgi:hypothetical protein
MTCYFQRLKSSHDSCSQRSAKCNLFLRNTRVETLGNVTNKQCTKDSWDYLFWIFLSFCAANCSADTLLLELGRDVEAGPGASADASEAAASGFESSCAFSRALLLESRLCCNMSVSLRTIARYDE